MSLGSGVTPFNIIEAVRFNCFWQKDAPNPPCQRESCRHQHERADVKNNQVIYSPCKVLMISGKDEEGRVRKTQCDCSVRI